MSRPEPEYGNPPYPQLGEGVAKYRRAGEITKAYGEAVLAAFRSLHRRSLMREVPEAPKVYNDGKSLLRALRAKQRAALAACPGQQRRARTPQQWQEMYEEAMAEKQPAPAQRMRRTA